MNPESESEYIRPIDKIYAVATNKDELDWKGFLHELINKENLNPWDLDLSVLTSTYLQTLRELKQVDFEISGKLLTIAVFLLKEKAEYLVEHDLRGIERQIELVEQSDLSLDEDLLLLGNFDHELEEIELQKKKQKYSIKIRNPIARKRRVNIFDLIKTLEKTFEQSNRRRKNFLLRNKDVEYSGPEYSKKPKDLKTIIEELFHLIQEEFSQKNGVVHFSFLTTEAKSKMCVLEKFIPLLHLHNQEKLTINQKEHFGEIFIHSENKRKD